jgi:hypothetical protein
MFSSLFCDNYFPSYSQYCQKVADFDLDLDENMLNDIIIDFFLVSISKKGIKLDFWMVNLLKNNFPRTLQTFLCKINLTNFWGQIKPTYLCMNG